MNNSTRPTDDEVLTVTQADRDAAADFVLEDYGDQLWADSIRSGEMASSLVRAFSRHRLSRPAPAKHIAAEPGEVERVASAIHDARFGPDYPASLPRDTLATTDRSGREYCYRLARAALATLTPTETRTAGEGALADAAASLIARWEHVNQNAMLPGDYKAVDACVSDLLAALRNPPTDRESVCEHCGGNGYSGGVVPAEDMRGEYDCACEVCCGTGKSRPTDRESIRAEMREECAKVADNCAVLADRVEAINHFGVEAAENAVKLAEGIATAIRAIPTGDNT